MSNKISQIKTVAGNIITSISGSGPIYAPYVPLQTTMLGGNNSKSLPSIDLSCNNSKEVIYQFAIGKSYEFLLNYMKTIKPDDTDLNEMNTFSTDSSQEEYRIAIRRYVHEFQSGDKLFISEIDEVCNRFYYASEYSRNKADDYNITLVSVSHEQAFSFRGTEIIDLLDRQIIKELV